MGAFFQELIHTGIYKRSQGRITRQVTWAAMAITVTLGLWQLSHLLVGFDPGIRSEIRAEHPGRVKFTRVEGEHIVLILDANDRELEQYEVPEGADLKVKPGQAVQADALLCQWSNVWVLAGIRYGIPGGLLLAGLWVAYRIVNVPNFADFLIAVEAEMNKVSWPTRTELFRASLVVLFTIFALAATLFLFDSFWKTLFWYLGIFGS